MNDDHNSTSFECQVCGGKSNPIMESNPQAVEHLRTAHYMTSFQGTKSMQFHLDCADYYISTYKYTIGGVEFLGTFKRERESARRLRELKESRK